jgi:LmbE family N-acetylglucosaminyl deacetylase
VATAVVTATHGQAGRFRGEPPGAPSHPGAEALAVIRERELRAAAEALGVSDLTLLGYADGRLDQVDPAEAVARIAFHLRRFRPQVVVTFGSDGAYGHPDHVAICQFTTAAVVAAADPHARVDGEGTPAPAPHAVSKLYWMAWPVPKMEAYEAAFKRMVSIVDGVERSVEGAPDWAITAAVDTRAVWEQVWRAVSCHDSQIAGYQALRTIGPEYHEALWGSQHFYRVLSTVNGGRARESDLFEGIS